MKLDVKVVHRDQDPKWAVLFNGDFHSAFPTRAQARAEARRIRTSLEVPPTEAAA